MAQTAPAAPDALARYEAASHSARQQMLGALRREVVAVDRAGGDVQARARARLALALSLFATDRPREALQVSRAAATMIDEAARPDLARLAVRARLVEARSAFVLRSFDAAHQAATSAARLVGERGGPDDGLWHAALLEEAVTRSRRADLARVEPESLLEVAMDRGDVGRRCAGIVISRRPGVGEDPVYPVLSLMIGQGGGGVLGLSADAEGKVLTTRTLAWMNDPGFAVALVAAARSWAIDFAAPPGVDTAACRREFILPVIFAVGVAPRPQAKR
jgi:hypothetical protein